METVGVRTWPDECDNEACAGPLQPDELARLRRGRRRLTAWTVAFWLLLAAGVALTLVTWQTLPDPAPTHVGSSGPDEWGSPRDWAASQLVGLALLGVCGPGLGRLLTLLPMDLVNAAPAPYWKTPERFPIAMTQVRVFLMATMTAALGLVLVATYGSWELGHSRPFPDGLMVAATALVGAELVAGIVMLFRAMRPPQWWKDCRRAHGHRWG